METRQEFNPNPIGPSDYLAISSNLASLKLKRATFPEIVKYVSSCVKGTESEDIKTTLKKHTIVGFTDVLWTARGFYAINGNFQGKLDEEHVRAQLGSLEEKGVVFSQDGSVAFASSKLPTYRLGEVHRKNLERNAIVLASTGSLENASKLAEIESSVGYTFNPTISGIIPVNGEVHQRVIGIHSLFGKGRFELSGIINPFDISCVSYGKVKKS